MGSGAQPGQRARAASEGSIAYAGSNSGGGASSTGGPFGDMLVNANRRVFAYLIETLNNSFPDYDYSSLNPANFERVASANPASGSGVAGSSSSSSSSSAVGGGRAAATRTPMNSPQRAGISTALQSVCLSVNTLLGDLTNAEARKSLLATELEGIVASVASTPDVETSEEAAPGDNAKAQAKRRKRAESANSDKEKPESSSSSSGATAVSDQVSASASATSLNAQSAAAAAAGDSHAPVSAAAPRLNRKRGRKAARAAEAADKAAKAAKAAAAAAASIEEDPPAEAPAPSPHAVEPAAQSQPLPPPPPSHRRKRLTSTGSFSSTGATDRIPVRLQTLMSLVCSRPFTDVLWDILNESIDVSCNTRMCCGTA